MDRQSFCTGCMNKIWDVLFRCSECLNFDLCLQCVISGFETEQHKRSHQFVLHDLGTFFLFEQEEQAQENALAMEVDESDDEKDEIDISDFLGDKIEFEKFIKDEFGRLNFSPVPIIPRIKSELKKEEDQEDSEEDKKAQDQVELSSVSNEKHNWRALEEILMLEGIAKEGYGNWIATADALNRTLHLKISPEEVKRHYYNHYINGIIGNLTMMWMHTDPFVIHMSNFPDRFSYNNGKLKVFENQENKYADITPELLPVGYTSTRDDFERDFDQEAEYLISNIVFAIGEECNIENRYKMAQIDMYQRRLLQRFRKRTLVCENGFMRSFLDKSKHSKESLKNHHILAPFMRYLTKDEFENLTRDLMKEHYLKLFLKKLVIQYYQSLGEGGTDITEVLRNKRLKADHSDEIGTTPEEKEIFEKLLSNCDEFDKDILKYWFKVESTHSILKVTKHIASEINSPNMEKFLQQVLDFIQKSTTVKSKKTASKRVVQEDFDAAWLPGAHLLSKDEIELCNELRLIPAVYLNYKTILIKDHGNCKQNQTLDSILSSSKFKCNSSDELNAMRRVYLYMASHGLLGDSSQTCNDISQPSTSHAI